MPDERLIAIRELHDLVSEFSILADDRDARGQGLLFTEDAVLEFQMGIDGEVHEIPGRAAIVDAFESTVGAKSTAKAVYHANGQQKVEVSADLSKATGTAYCMATLVNDENGKDVITTNYVRYADEYVKLDGRWYIKRRRTCFLISEKRPYNI
jgi:hypothetical protein